ncbi:kinesin-like protein KIFC1 [Calonectris borealis]|uniref:kinesin-like protein KIFC1 n=1 Tax=Calonectris borealis TaxID=1323832 RepID=UPI003F4BE503
MCGWCCPRRRSSRRAWSISTSPQGQQGAGALQGRGAVLSLVDLAGSEQLDELLLGEEQPHESQAISASFSTLGQVIMALAKKIGVSESRSPGGEVHRVLHLPALCKQGMTSTVSSPNRRK